MAYGSCILEQNVHVYADNHVKYMRPYGCITCQTIRWYESRKIIIRVVVE